MTTRRATAAYTASELLAVMSARLLQRRPGGVRRRRHPAAGGDLGAAAARPGPDHSLRGRHHRRLRRARAIAALDQRAALHAARQHGAEQHRRVAAAAAWLCRCRLHGRRADRPIRQPQQLVYRRRRQAGDAAAGNRRRQRHRQPDADDRRDEAREAPLRRAGRFHHQPGLSVGRHQPARQRLVAGGMSGS